MAWAVTAYAQPAPDAWYDAADALDSDWFPAGDGAVVGLWPDKSGNGIDLHHRNPGVDIAITYQAAGSVNGLPSVRWGGGSGINPSGGGGAQNHQYLTSWDSVGNPGGNGASPFLASNELTIIAIGEYRYLGSGAAVSVYDTTHGAPEWGQNDPDSSMEDGGMIGYGGMTGWHHNYMSNYASVSNTGGPIAIMEGVYGTTPEDTAIFVNGVFGSYPPSTASNDTWGTQHVLGDLDDAPFSPRGVKLGHADFWHAGWSYADMDLCEVLIYARKLTDAERWDVGAYLNQKYGVDYTNDVNLAVPEPCTMMLIGLGSLALLRRRRN